MPSGAPRDPRAGGNPPLDPVLGAEMAAEDEDLYYRGARGDEEWIRFRRPWGFGARTLLVLVTLAIMLGGGYLAVNGWVQRQLDPPGDPSGEVSVEIPSGAGVGEIARMLADQGVVPNSIVTRLAWRNEDIQAGEYVMAQNMSVNEALEVLDEGPLPPPFISVTIPEGLWVSEIFERLIDGLPEFDVGELTRALYSGTIRSKYQPEGVNNLEGMLFGETYHIDQAQAGDEAALVGRLVAQFDKVAMEVGYDNVEYIFGGALTPYQVIVIASIIEGEASRDEDRPKVARVIYNRINTGMSLGMDATVLYALGERKADLTLRDLDIDSPYNTRKFPGIPPGPISSPGRKSLEAALNPAVGDWLYFVLQERDGTLFFSESYEEFLHASDDARRRGVF